MLDRYLRPLKAKALAPLARRAVDVHPDTLTVVGAVVGVGAAVAAASGAFTWALVAWWTNRIVDGLDGDVARLRREATVRGAYVDLMADIVVYASLPLGVAYGATRFGGADAHATWVAAAALAMAYYVNLASHAFLAQALVRLDTTRPTGARAGAPTGASSGDAPGLHLPAGLVEGAETIVAMSVVLALPSAAPWTLGVFAAATFASAVQRMVWGARHLPGRTGRDPSVRSNTTPRPVDPA